MGKIENVMLYAGADRDSYNEIKEKIRKANRTMVVVLSSMASFLIGAMYLSSMRSESVMQNRYVYGLGLILSIVITILSTTLARRFPILTMPLVYASYSIYYMYGILIGAVTDADGKTVTFMVMLVFLPTIFIDRPIHVICVTVLYDFVFIILCLMHKTGTVLSVDTMDAVIFGILGITSGSTINRMKVRGYISEQKLEKISRIDQLTGMNNQNSFKLDLYSIPKQCKRTLACIYFDANGLHDLNNSKGHAEGDRLLQHVAEQIRECFGDKFTYRTGGDEFVAFVIDPNRESLVRRIGDLIQAVEDANYSVAVGYEIFETNHHRFSIDELVKAADLRMQEDKRIYHKEHAR